MFLSALKLVSIYTFNNRSIIYQTKRDKIVKRMWRFVLILSQMAICVISEDVAPSNIEGNDPLLR